MNNNDELDNNQKVNDESNLEQADNLDEKAQNTDTSASPEATENTEDNGNDLSAKINDLNDKYLRLYSEFDNYRKRTLKERSDLLKSANEDVLKAILPVIDDFERAIKANENVTEVQAIKDGVNLIYNKLKNIAQQKGLTPFESKGQLFDADLMEAITHVPSQTDDEKGKVIDEIEKGYKLGDKVIRFAKVVVGT